MHYSAQMWVILPFWSFSPANSFRIQVVFDHFHYPFLKKGISVSRVFWVLDRITGQGLPCIGEAAFHSWVGLVQMLDEGCLMWVAATSQEPVEITIAGSLSLLYCLLFLSCGGRHSAHHPQVTKLKFTLAEVSLRIQCQASEPSLGLACSAAEAPEQVCCEVLCHGEQFQVSTQWFWEFHVMLFKIRGSAYVIWGPVWRLCFKSNNSDSRAKISKSAETYMLTLILNN